MKSKTENTGMSVTPSLKKWSLIFVALFFILWIAVSNFVYVVGVNNGSLSGAMYPLIEENWDHPRLQKLGFDERLLRVVADGATEFEKIVMLRGWVHRQWKGESASFCYPAWDAMEILTLARNHGNKAFCAQYAIVFLQACLSIGIPARYVDLPGHFVVEIWSNDFNKWVVMDPTGDIHFRRDDDVLDGIDLCEAYWKDSFRDIVKVSSDKTRTQIVKEDIGAYRDYSFLVKNNQLTDPMVVTVNGADRKLVLETDHKKYPYVGRDMVEFTAEILAWDQEGQTEKDSKRKRSNDPSDFRFPMNQTIIDVLALNQDKGEVRLGFRGVNSSSFVGFMVMKGNPGIWRESDANMLYKLKPGMNKFSCRIKSRFGRLGKIASIKLYYKANWLKRPKD
ncbi:MAG: hypothetical protein A2901_06035 [Elusimicrobia bacterium RIFCSPLOWO2_01_FULL_54_10]|nr:MAG: hypothetical protein A2901_06035 [Elusimicrobia bacterium RIFCSPLOWO2_01_FULL_54_10]